MGKIIEGFWNCPYCGAQKIQGHLRECPSCGKARGEDTVFGHDTPGEENTVKEPETVSREADWHCEYCDALNPADAETCLSCGAPRTDKDYFDMREKKKEKEEAAKPQPSVPEPRKASASSRLPLLIVLAAAIFLLIYLSSPKKASLQVRDRSWERNIAVEQLTTLKENGWSVPDGGRVYDQKEEIHHYDSVLDHYQTVEREVGERVVDHYETVVTGYKDLGNGYFEEITEEQPVYTTVYHTETFQEPVYITIPRYATVYYYEIERWVYERTETARGTGKETPAWPEISLAEQEREGNRTESYTLTAVNSKGKEFYYTCRSEEEWQKLKEGTSLNVRASGSQIEEILDN